MLWVDRYRPQSLDKLDYHPQLTAQMTKMAESGDLPHLLFYGPSGSGKKTRIVALLRALYGPGVERLKTEQKVFKAGSKQLTITTLNSLYHIEINPADAGIHDRIVLQEILHETSQTAQLNRSAQKGFKVVILNEADRMTKEAQHTLRRTMEKYAENCRLILCCENLSKLIEPLRSRCLAIRVAAPNQTEICDILTAVARKERLELPADFATRIAVSCDHNLRRALLMLEASKVEKYPFTSDQLVSLPDWQRFIGEMAKSIIGQQNPKRLLEIRNQIYELLQNCIPPTIIIKTLLNALCECVPENSLKYAFIEAAAHCEHRLQQGTKDIFHLESFVAKVMALYKRYAVEMFSMQ